MIVTNHTNVPQNCIFMTKSRTKNCVLLAGNEIVHDLSAPAGDVYTDAGFIAPLDPYQGEIRLATFNSASEPSRGTTRTYVERRQTTEYLN